MDASTKSTGWRRVASAIWSEPRDPQIYGWLEVDATWLLAFIQRARESGEHVTPTHIVGRAIAEALGAVPEMNTHLRHGRFVPRPSVEIFFITAVAGGHDLSGVKVDHADQKSAIQVSRELSPAARTLKAGTDRGFNRSKHFMEAMPFPFLRPLLRLIAWWVGSRGRSVRPLGLAARPFGSAMVSSIGMFGVPQGFSPLAWLYRVPILVLAGAISPRPMAVEGRVEIRPVLPITASIDHRYADGAQIARLFRVFTDYLGHPERYEPALTAMPKVMAEVDDGSASHSRLPGRQ